MKFKSLLLVTLGVLTLASCGGTPQGGDGDNNNPGTGGEGGTQEKTTKSSCGVAFEKVADVCSTATGSVPSLSSKKTYTPNNEDLITVNGSNAICTSVRMMSLFLKNIVTYDSYVLDGKVESCTMSSTQQTPSGEITETFDIKMKITANVEGNTIEAIYYSEERDAARPEYATSYLKFNLNFNFSTEDLGSFEVSGIMGTPEYFNYDGTNVKVLSHESSGYATFTSEITIEQDNFIELFPDTIGHDYSDAYQQAYLDSLTYKLNRTSFLSCLETVEAAGRKFFVNNMKLDINGSITVDGDTIDVTGTQVEANINSGYLETDHNPSSYLLGCSKAGIPVGGNINWLLTESVFATESSCTKESYKYENNLLIIDYEGVCAYSNGTYGFNCNVSFTIKIDNLGCVTSIVYNEVGTGNFQGTPYNANTQINATLSNFTTSGTSEGDKDKEGETEKKTVNAIEWQEAMALSQSYDKFIISETITQTTPSESSIEMVRQYDGTTVLIDMSSKTNISKIYYTFSEDKYYAYYDFGTSVTKSEITKSTYDYFVDSLCYSFLCYEDFEYNKLGAYVQIEQDIEVSVPEDGSAYVYNETIVQFVNAKLTSMSRSYVNIKETVIQASYTSEISIEYPDQLKIELPSIKQ